MRHILRGAALATMIAISMSSLLACSGSDTIDESDRCKNMKSAIRQEIADRQNLPPERNGEPCGDETTEPEPYYSAACEMCDNECGDGCVLGD